MTYHNMLIDPLPTSLTVNGVDYEIDTDYRVGILFELLIQDRSLSPAERIVQAIALFFPDEVPPMEDLRAAFEGILWFYRCGKDKPKTKGDGDNEGPSQQMAYSFEHDDQLIYAAFMSEYGIDLTTAELHWWQFRALFRSLPETAQIVKVMGYRTAKISDKMSNGEKQFIRKMKRLYALPLSKEEQEYNDRLKEALMNGGDLTGIL